MTFFIAGEPKGQPRPRAFARKMGNKYVARVFDAGTAEAWKTQVALAAKPFRPDKPLLGPVGVELFFHLARPKSHFKGGEVERGLKPAAPNYHTGKPDCDNLAKAVLDALTQVSGFWHDDAQVSKCVIRKSYAEESGCTVSITALKDFL